MKKVHKPSEYPNIEPDVQSVSPPIGSGRESDPRWTLTFQLLDLASVIEKLGKLGPSLKCSLYQMDDGWRALHVLFNDQVSVNIRLDGHFFPNLEEFLDGCIEQQRVARDLVMRSTIYSESIASGGGGGGGYYGSGGGWTSGNARKMWTVN